MNTASPRRTAPLRLALAAGLLASAAPALAQQDWRQHDLSRPRPEVVTPPAQTLPTPVPEDAVVLYGGGDLSAWVSVNGGPAPWTVEGDSFVVAPGTGGIRTVEGFGDVQLHVEWSAPDEIVGESQGRGNSGVFLMNAYEVQVLDSFENESYADGQAAAIYGQFPPLANAMRTPQDWQAYDIFFRRPRFGPAGALIEPARLTVLHNGILVQNNEELWGGTNWLQASPYVSHPDALPIMLQDHGNPVAFRNIWVRPLAERPLPAAAGAPAVSATVALTPEELDRYVGVYAFWDGNATRVRRDGDRLLVSILGPELELAPLGEDRFAFTRTDATLSFQLTNGAPTGVVMSLGGVDYTAPRVSQVN